MALAFWRVVNPAIKPFAGIAPWWVILETTGQRSGEPRRVPLARGPEVGSTTWVIAAHGEHATFARNLAANPAVRLKIRGRWRDGTAKLEPLDPEMKRRFNAYARAATGPVGIDPMLVRIDFDD
jgi:deazaflavin-dependent oxidoreductase (nitroreductase family)